MTILLGAEKAIRLGVHRLGRGAVVYTAKRAGLNPDYDAALRQLLVLLLNPEELERHFPPPTGNALVEDGDNGGEKKT
jgi:hypothetical protein